MGAGMTGTFPLAIRATDHAGSASNLLVPRSGSRLDWLWVGPDTAPRSGCTLGLLVGGSLPPIGRPIVCPDVMGMSDRPVSVPAAMGSDFVYFPSHLII